MKNNRGVTLITIGIAIVVMLIILATILFNARNITTTQKIDNLYNDLRILGDKVNIYYWKYGSLPIKEEFTQISKIPSNVLNPNDSGKYYVIDLNAIENLSLNSNNAVQNIYVINEDTHTIYFPAGVEVEGVTYYRLPEEFSVFLPQGWDSSKVGSTVTEISTINAVNKERNVPIPKGFVVSQIDGEDTIAEGLVIYQGTEPVVGEKNSAEHINAMKTRNQYVWIPVDNINNMVMCKLNNANNDKTICNLTLEENSTGGYTLRCMTHNATGDNTTMTKLCGRIYGTEFSFSNNSIFTTNMNFSDRTQQWSATEYREPDIVTTYDTEENTKGLEIFKSKMSNDFTAMAISVAKYGGFFVSRYEIGYEEINGVPTNGISKRNKVVLTASGSDGVEYKSANTWYGLYNVVHNEIAVGTSTIQSHMIYGCQYDQIINFIGPEAQKGHIDNVVKTQSLTGTLDTDKLNNIYDLEGNNMEWTAQAYGTQNRMIRGGDYYNADAGWAFPASDVYPGTTTAVDWRTTTRSTLYF